MTIPGAGVKMGLPEVISHWKIRVLTQEEGVCVGGNVGQVNPQKYNDYGALEGHRFIEYQNIKKQEVVGEIFREFLQTFPNSVLSNKSGM